MLNGGTFRAEGNLKEFYTYVDTATDDASHVCSMPDAVVAAAFPITVVAHVQVERIKAATDARHGGILIIGKLVVAPANASVHDKDLDSCGRHKMTS